MCSVGYIGANLLEVYYFHWKVKLFQGQIIFFLNIIKHPQTNCAQDLGNMHLENPQGEFPLSTDHMSLNQI